MHLPFEDESFEVVTMLAVLEHLNHPLAIIKEIRRVLTPNGKLILTSINQTKNPLCNL